MKYRSKPVEVEAFRLPLLNDSPDAFVEWAEEVGLNYTSERNGYLEFTNPEFADPAVDTVPPGWWIIKQGEGFFTLPDDLFKERYVAVVIPTPSKPYAIYREYNPATGQTSQGVEVDFAVYERLLKSTDPETATFEIITSKSL